jgi:RNA polymerase sigma factor (sigma-70 family)
VRGRDDEWTDLMRSANAGDSVAYHRLLKSVTPVLRAGARQGLSRAGQPPDQAEDIVQDILLAVHLKRQTWDANAPFAPWLFAIARNKLIDALRRRGRRVFVNIDDFAETIPSEAAGRNIAHGRDIQSSRRSSAAAARRVAIDRGGERIHQDHGVEIVDDRRRRARGVASWAREPRSQAAKGLIMDTDRLIQTLAADNDQRPRSVSTQLAMALLVTLPVVAAMLLVTLGIRPDFMSAMRNPFFDTKFLVTLGARHSSHRDQCPSVPARGVVGALDLAAAAVAVHSHGIALIVEMTMPQRAPMMVRIIGRNSSVCIGGDHVAVAADSRRRDDRAAPRRAVTPRHCRCARGIDVSRARGDVLCRALRRRLAAVCRDLVHARSPRRGGAGCSHRFESAALLMSAAREPRVPRK